MRQQFANLFERTGKTSRLPAERLACMGANTREEVLRMMANDPDLMGMVFDQAVKAGVIERDSGACGWTGRNTAARLAHAEDWEP